LNLLFIKNNRGGLTNLLFFGEIMIDLYNGDCLKELKELKSNSVDLILTDPPYIISRDSGYTNTKLDKYKSHKIDFGEWDKEELELDTLFKEYYRVLRKGGTLIMFYDIWKFQEAKVIAESVKFKQPRIGTWIKNNPVPINSKINYLSNAIEYFMTFVKGGKPTYHSKYDKGLYEYPICHGKERTKHPTQKPLKLIKKLIEKHSNESDLVIDPFMGSGTTGVACKELNRNFVGMELDESYFKIAKERLNE
jgi:site-specific DNA-methyltransferase (adenine-specific)